MLQKELEMSMQIATSDIFKNPSFPIVHIYVADEEIGVLTIDGGELIEGDLGSSFLKYTQERLAQIQSSLLEKWDEMAAEGVHG